MIDARRCTDKFMLRLPDGWRDELKAMAARNRRSMNSEIVLILGAALGAETAATGEKFGDRPPAAARNTAALQGSDIINHGY